MHTVDNIRVILSYCLLTILLQHGIIWGNLCYQHLLLARDYMPTQTLYDKTVKNAQAGEVGRIVYGNCAISCETSLSSSFGLRVTGNDVKS